MAKFTIICLKKFLFQDKLITKELERHSIKLTLYNLVGYNTFEYVSLQNKTKQKKMNAK